MAAEIFRFGEFELDLSAYELRRGGTALHLQRIPFQLLSLLVERRGQLVTREEILERIWGKGVFVDSENSINAAVRKVRRTLNDVAGAPRFIITVPARGYRFAVPTSLRPPTPSVGIYDMPSPLPWRDKPSIAVLPFTNMSGDRDQEYFSDGITDDLITAISGVSGLFVIARSSTFTYKGKAAKVQDVGRELGVAYVLEGSVRKSDNNLRITAQLVDTTGGNHLWAERYDRPLKDIFALQDEIVQKIVATLKLQLTLEQQGWVSRKHTDNLEAYDCSCAGWWSLLISRKREMPRHGCCGRRPWPWTRSMRRRTRSWGGPITGSGSTTGVLTPRPRSGLLNWCERPSLWMIPCRWPIRAWASSIRCNSSTIKP